MKLLTDPRLFPAIILALFALAAMRYTIDRDWPQVGYYAGALILNLAVMAMAK